MGHLALGHAPGISEEKMDTQTKMAPVAKSGFVTKNRAAVSLLFLMNGFFVGCWAPKIPEFAERLQLSKFQLGLMILVFGLGSLTMMPIAGAQIARHGSRLAPPGAPRFR